MSDRMILTIDGAEIEAKPGHTILQAADDGGIYIPRLCAHKELEPFGACRVCTVMVNGRPQAACTTPQRNCFPHLFLVSICRMQAALRFLSAIRRMTETFDGTGLQQTQIHFRLFLLSDALLSGEVRASV